MREQAIQETEQLNMKNAQLADLNNELTRRIQGQFKANKHQVPGLGIYDGSQGDLLELKDPEKRPATATTTTTSLNTIGVPYSETSEGTEVFTAQKVEPFKNGAQQKKFFWKKPGQTLMKGAGKVGRVFGGENQGGTNGFENQSYKPPGAANKKQKTNRGNLAGSGCLIWVLTLVQCRYSAGILELVRRLRDPIFPSLSRSAFRKSRCAEWTMRASTGSLAAPPRCARSRRSLSVEMMSSSHRISISAPLRAC